MRRIPRDLLIRMAGKLSGEERDEMAIPSYLHPNAGIRWMAWRRVEVIARRLRRTCVSQHRSTKPVVMDFGCGTGILFEEASHYAQHIYGVDVVLEAANLLVEEWHLRKVTLLTPEQAENGIPEKSVDIILAAEVLEHLDPRERTLSWFRRCLKSNGKLLVSLPTEGMLYRIGRRLAGFQGHYHHSNAHSIHHEIERAGFTLERIEKIPAPGPFAIYWVVDYCLP